MYDYAHPLEDAFEGVTHSICTLEFESNRELYDWVLDHTGPWDPRPRQYEFARLALGYTVMSKRKLLQLVNEKRVSGWDDPRMPTIAGMRRRGVTPEALRDFAEMIGVAKNNSVVDIGKLEFCVRGDLEKRSPRALAVLDPVRLTLVNWTGPDEELDVPWWPAEPERGGSRKVPFGRDLLVERDDFSSDPPPDWRRLAPGREVRLAGAHVVRCEDVVRGADGQVTEIRCTVDRASRDGGTARRGIGTLHWVHASQSVPARVRLYDRLFTVEQPDAEGNFLDVLNPDSLAVAAGARVEPALRDAAPGTHWQFLRQGYFFVDPVDSRPGAPVFNRTMTLKDTWSTRSSAGTASPSRPVRPPRDAAPTAPRRSQAELRAEARATDPALAALHARLAAIPGLAAEQADALSVDPAAAGFLEGAVAAGAPAGPAARWMLNDLAGLSRGGSVAALGIDSGAFARFVSLAESGRTTAAGAKTLLSSLVERPGDPVARLAELGLERVDDRSAVDGAVARVLVAQAAEVARYRAGEKKLLAFLLGAAMRELKGKADPAVLRNALQEALG
jgi:glutaminyl-tRNA synthetase